MMMREILQLPGICGKMNTQTAIDLFGLLACFVAALVYIFYRIQHGINTYEDED